MGADWLGFSVLLSDVRYFLGRVEGSDISYTFYPYVREAFASSFLAL